MWRAVRCGCGVAARVGGIVAVASGVAAVCVPLPRARLATYPAATRVVDRHGAELRVVLGSGDCLRHVAPLERMGVWAADALIAAEDKRFYRHGGIDPWAIGRAAVLNVWRRRVVSGASTLTTQVVKMVTPRGRTPLTKVIEAVHAVRLEREWSKHDILAQYLNRAPMGGNVYGVQSAARRYFGRDATDLTLGETALLLGLPQAPSRYRPDRYPARAAERRDYVLRRMAALGVITDAQRQAAERQPVRVETRPNVFRAPHFCDFVLQRHGGRIGGETRADAGDDGVLRTTLDARIQAAAEDTSRALTARLGRDAEVAVAVVVLDVASGEVRALVGSGDYDQPTYGQVNCAVLPRSPGSALKPFLYALAIDQGRCTPDTLLRDEPRRFRGYVPENFQRTFRGAVSAREALVASLNIPALTLAEAVGLETFAAGLCRVGIGTLDKPPEHYGLSMVLGTVEVTLLELVNAYACLARLGEYAPYRVLSGETAEGGGVAAGALVGTRVFSPEAAYMVAGMLSGPERAQAGTGHVGDTVGARVAWKTGTSNGYRDAWTIAYNPEYVVGVWVGNPRGGTDIRLVGIEAAAPSALALFRGLYPDGAGPWYTRPPGLTRCRICPSSGMRAGPRCPVTTEGDTIEGVSDPVPCRGHADSGSMAEGVGEPGGPVAAPAGGRARLAIASPADGARYIRGDTLPLERQAVALKATGAEGDVWWFVNRRPCGKTAGDGSLPWPLEPGTHRITCADAAGRTAAVTIAVRW